MFESIKGLLLNIAVTVGSKFVTSDLVARLSRTAVQKVGSGLVVHGFMTGNDLEAIGGAVAALTATLFTIVSAQLAKRAAESEVLGGAPAVPANPTTGGLL